LLVSFFFGFSFVIDAGSSVDSTRYARDLRLAHEEQVTFQEYVLAGYLDNEGGELDIYQPTLTWVVSLFTSDYRWLFGLYALVFGYFWFKSLLLIRQYLSPELATLSVIVLVTIAGINPIWNINGVRMWTAIQIFFYGLLLLYLQGKTYKGWLMMAAAPLIHFSLAVGLVVFIVYYLLPFKNIHLLFLIYLFSLFVNELNFDFLREQFEKLPGFLQSRKGYLDEGYIEGVKERKNIVTWHVTFAREAEKYTMILMLVWIYIKGHLYRSAEPDKNKAIFTFTLFFGAFSNLVANIPSGGRFMVLAYLLAGLSFLLFLRENHQRFHPLLKPLLQGALLFIIVFRIRLGMNHIGAFFFFGNPFINLFIVDDVPFISFIKQVIT
jgi:hypothetical protein